MPREYPRIGSWGGKPRWSKDPKSAPRCIAPGCSCRATRQPWIEVSWFRGEDERSGPVCQEHSEAPPAQLLEWARAWKTENQRRGDEANARAAARKATGGAPMTQAQYVAWVLAEQEALAAALRRRIEQAHRFTGWPDSDTKAAAIADYTTRLRAAEAWSRLRREQLELLQKAEEEAGKAAGGAP